MSESERPSWGLITAREAGLLTSLFLVASDTVAPGGNPDELGGGRVVREALAIAVVLGVVTAFGGPFVGLVVLGVIAVFKGTFVGLLVPLRVAGAFLSAALELPNMDRRVVLDIMFLGPLALLNVGDTPTTLFTGLESVVFLFSPSESIVGFLVSSAGPIEDLDL